MNRSLLLAMLFVAAPACTPSKGDFLLSVGAYQSPDFVNILGTSQFHMDGTTHSPDPTYSISLSVGIPSIYSLDSSEGEGSMSPPSNNDPTRIFSGTAISTITLNGVVESIADAYMFQAPPPLTLPFTSPTFSG